MNNKFKNLPPLLYLLPIKGMVLLPRAQLPLPILNPKHFAMITHVWHTHKTIGIVQIKDNINSNHDDENEDDDGENIDVYQAGTAGFITDIGEFEDNRLFITLKGISRFKITQEVENESDLRQAYVNYEPYQGDHFTESDFSFDRQRLFKSLSVYFDHHNIDANWDEINHVSNDRLITALSMACPFTASERQALLECSSIKEQSSLILSLIEMANLEDIYKTRAYH